MYLTDSVNTFTENVVFYFTILLIAKIRTDLMDYCLAKCARNLVLFYFYFPIAEIKKDFRETRCEFM